MAGLAGPSDGPVPRDGFNRRKVLLAATRHRGSERRQVGGAASPAPRVASRVPSPCRAIDGRAGTRVAEIRVGAEIRVEASRPNL